MKRRGTFIVFEGGDGGGKTTTAAFVARALKASGIGATLTHEPGGTSSGKKIKRLLIDTRIKKLHPRTELLLFLADRALHVEEVIKPALAKGNVVICDRFDGATFAYQGGGRGINAAAIAALNSFAKDGVAPDLYVLFDIAPEIGLNRLGKNVDRFEKEKLAFHRRVRKAYLDMAKKDRTRWVVVNAEQPLEDVKQKVLEIFKKRKII